MSNMDRPKVTLIGLDGNAFLILGRCEMAWLKSGGTREQWDTIYAQMTAGDYDNLLSVAQHYFEVG